ncbi:MAG: hypothetical protein LRY71_01220 [Bacillaceae bacterium]|nr:hypothetical protein [Bacillaceae bacterium]
MNQKVNRIIQAIGGIIAIASGLLTILGKIIIPGLAPFSLAVVMVTFVFSIRYQYKGGIVKENYYRVMLGIGIVGVILNIMAGIVQIIN